MHDTLQKTTLWHKKWATLLYSHPPSHSSGTIFVFPIPLLPPPTPPPTYLVPLLPTYLPNYPPSTSTFPFFCPPSLSIMLLPSLTSCDLHFTITKFPQHLLPWPNLVTPNLCVQWPSTTPSTFHLHHAYICLHLSLFPCHKQAINFKLVIIFLVLYIYMK
jgi:hypothetical protein